VTPAAAQRDYGVVLREDGTLDEEATRRARSAAAAE
jgi:hypothetical protein